MSYQKHNWVTREIIRREYLQNIEDGIFNEQERAIAAEDEIASRLSTETSRAVGKENELSGSINSLSSSLTDEISRATTKENVLESSIGAEITRATTVEEQLSTTLESVSTSLANEVTRARGAENTLQDNIDAEETRARGAETTLQSNITAEATRATQAESALHDYVDQKVTGLYKPSGSIYFADLPALATSRLGNVYDVIDEFTTTSDFREGLGKKYGPGTNVAIIDIGNGTLKYDCLPGSIVVGVKGDAESNYRIGQVNITKANIGLGNVGNYKAVSTIANQGLTEAEKTAARANIGAGSESQTVTVDTELSTSSENPVQNKVIANEIYKFDPQSPLPENTDLNDLKINGFYYTPSSSIAATFSNCPTTQAFFLEVGKHAGIMQRLTEYKIENPKIYFRNYYAYVDSWGEWKRIYTTADKPTKSDVGLGNVPNVSTNDQTPTFSQASSRANIASGEKLSTIFGKIMKFFADLKTVAFTGSYNDLSNKPNYAGSNSAGGPANLIYTPRSGGNYNDDIPGLNKTKIVEHSTESPNRPSDHWYYVMTSQGADPNYATQLALGMTTTLHYFREYQGGSWSPWYRLYTTANKPSKSDVGLGNVENVATTSANRGWAGNNVSWDTMADGYYGTNPNQLPTELQSLFSSYSYFSTYGTLHLNKGTGGVYPVIEYMDVYGQGARWNSNQHKWTPFRRPTGNATAAQVLSGYTFSNESSDGLSGNIPIKSGSSQVNTAYDNGTNMYFVFPYGYYPSESHWGVSNSSEIYIPHSNLARNIGVTGDTVRAGASILGVSGTAQSATFITSANSSAVDMGSTNTYRYVNTTGVYDKGSKHYANNRSGYASSNGGTELRFDLYDIKPGTILHLSTTSSRLDVAIRDGDSNYLGGDYIQTNHEYSFTVPSNFSNGTLLVYLKPGSGVSQPIWTWWSLSNSNY